MSTHVDHKILMLRAMGAGDLAQAALRIESDIRKDLAVRSKTGKRRSRIRSRKRELARVLAELRWKAKHV